MSNDQPKDQHTPEPWHVEKHGGRYEIWPKNDGQPHCSIAVVQKRTDADLIAAAPELLKALEAVLSDVGEEDMNDEVSVIAVSPEHIEQAKAAIAKAKS